MLNKNYWNAKRRREGEKYTLWQCNIFQPIVTICPHVCITLCDLSWPLTVIIQPDHTPIFRPTAMGWFISRQQHSFDGRFHFPADESATVMWWNECFVYQPPPSTQIDGACNWRPLCVTAKINRHCCGQGRSMSRTKQAREREDFMSHHIHRQHIVTISADFATVTHSCSNSLITFNNSVIVIFCIKLFRAARWCSG